MRRCFAIILWVTTVLVYLPVQRAYACEGEIATLEQLVAGSSQIVKATVIENDSLGQNSILQVESSLGIEPLPQYLLLSRNNIDTIERFRLQMVRSGECEMLVSEIPVNSSGYFLLNRYQNGTYSLSTPELFGNPAYYEFPAEFLLDSGEWQTFTEQEFLDYVMQTTGRQPAAPLVDAPYPLKAPLAITTESGQQYLFPVDGGAPVALEESLLPHREACTAPGCYNESMNGVFRATFEHDIHVRYVGYIGDMNITGDGFVVAPSSPKIAIWEGQQLGIYGIEMDNLPLLNQLEVAGTVQPQLVWSEDGHWLAYSDDGGLWLWDTETTQPQLLVPAEENGIPLALNFSLQGHYLRFMMGNTIQFIRLEDKTLLPDGSFAPDDSALLAFDTQQTGDVEIAYCQPECQPFLSHGKFPTWKDPQTILWIMCDEVCTVNETQLFPEPRSIAQYPGDAYVYDALNGVLAVVEEPHMLVIGSNRYDLGTQLDSPIASVAWLPSLFYRGDF